MKLLPFLLLSAASVLSVRSPAQVVVQPPGIRAVLAGPGITVNTNGFTRTISAPGAAGDITSVAVAGDMMSGGGTTGAVTITGPSTNSVRAAVSGIYLPLSGGTITGEINVNADLFINGSRPWTVDNHGSGSGLDADLLDGQSGAYYLNLANATNTLSRARLPTSQTTPYLHWSSKDCTFHTTAGVWWYPYENTSIDFGAFGLRAAASDDQLGTLRTDWTPVPSEAQAFAETSAITLTFAVSATTGVTECRGLRLMGRTGIGSPVTLYSDTTTRDGHASVAGGLVSFEIARSSFTSTNMVTHIQAEVDVSVEDAEIFALDGVKVGFQ